MRPPTRPRCSGAWSPRRPPWIQESGASPLCWAAAACLNSFVSEQRQTVFESSHESLWGRADPFPVLGRRRFTSRQQSRPARPHRGLWSGRRRAVLR